MVAPSGRDPRLEERDVRPVVGQHASSLPTWTAFVAIAMAGLMLFLLLDSRRRAVSAPAVDRVAVAMPSPPPLVIPPEPAPEPPPVAIVREQPAIVSLPPPPRYEPPRFSPPPQGVVPFVPPPRAPGSSDSALVVDTTTSDMAAAAPVASDGNATTEGVSVGGRARATMMHHGATTVPQGTLIAAVLETALDSTQPGLARAIVSHDVRGFDGSTVLIPRGSHLIGQYRADLRPGQKRALVIWTRLVRPDGVTIAIGSPSADPLGRMGIKGDVDGHFLERFGGAILQSALDIGVNVASRLGGSDTLAVVNVPNSLQSGGGSLSNGAQVQPTLKVKQGTPTSVFVARDLDFSGVGNRP